jgi:hypothetical protein
VNIPKKVLFTSPFFLFVGRKWRAKIAIANSSGDSSFVPKSDLLLSTKMWATT